MNQEYKNLKLTQLKPNQYNFRTTFDGPEFDELVDSIHSQGVLQPVLARPVKGKKPYEIVFGERRYRAALAASKRKDGKKTIPAMVRKLTDDQAYDLMIIENLQREDLNELEEARGFAAYLDKNSMEALPDLTARTGIKPAYIRRRVAILDLPEQVLEAWGRGEIRYGYLEQLTRLDDESEILGYFEDIIEGWEINTVRELKQMIDDHAIEMKHARFNLEKAGCLSCSSNSDVQMTLFEIDAQKAKCAKPDCFQENQKAWLDQNWNRTSFRKDYKTTGYRFADECQQSAYIFHDKKFVGDKCHGCSAFVTFFSGPMMRVHFKRACIGEKSCFDGMFKAKKESEKADAPESRAGEGKSDEPRVAWHGEYFREAFFDEAIPQRFAKISADELEATQLSLFALVKSRWELQHWFMEQYAGEQSPCCCSQEALFAPINNMDLNQVKEALKAATLRMIQFDDFGPDARRIVAGHVGIDLAGEWAITEEYLSKKHIPEIHGLGESLGVYSDPKAQAYLADEIGKKDFSACKKKELIEIFMESGVELTGKVPEEILN